jgi:hypothetical protein
MPRDWPGEFFSNLEKSVRSWRIGEYFTPYDLMVMFMWISLGLVLFGAYYYFMWMKKRRYEIHWHTIIVMGAVFLQGSVLLGLIYFFAPYIP